MLTARVRALVLLVWVIGGGQSSAQPAVPDLPHSDAPTEITYHVRDGDTLIGIGQRLLVREALWRAVGERNHVLHERRLPQGLELRIPADWIRWADRTARVVAVAGAVRLNEGAVAVDTAVRAGDTLTTDEGASAAVELSDGSQLRIPPHTTVVFQALRASTATDAPDIELRLPAGNLEVSARKHRDTGRLEIRSPTAITAVRGTTYRAHFNETTGSASAETLEGIVEVRDLGGAGVAVGGGFGTRVERDQKPIPPVALLPAPDLSGLPATHGEARLNWRFAAVTGARGYLVQLASAQDFRVLEAEALVPDAAVDLAVPSDGVHWLRVRALDALNLQGLDAVASFEQHTLPRAPAPVSPANGESAQAPVMLRWSGEGARYRVSLTAEGAADGTSLEVASNEVTTGGLVAGVYRWRVQALTPAGEPGPWSDASSVRLLPAPPVIDGVDARRGAGSSVRWAPKTGYTVELQLARDADFHQVVGTLRSDSGTATLPKLHPGRYHVRARWIVGDAVGSYGPSRMFTIWPSPWLLLLIPAGAALAAL